MNIPLRPYQVEALDAIKASLFGEDNTLCVAPTGSGKTRIMAAVLDFGIGIKPGFKAAILTGRIDLVTQTERAFREFFQAHQIGIYCGSLDRRETNRAITIVSVQSLKPNQSERYDLIIVDEVHRMDQEEGAYIRFIENCRALNYKMKVLGFTATPIRATGLIYGKDQLFSRICYRKSIPEMIDLGALVTPILRAGLEEHDTTGLRLRAGEYMQEDVDALVSDKEKCLAQVKDAISQLTDRQCIVWATANIDHCNMVADTLMSLGERCTTVHSKLKKGPRADNLAAFMAGSIRHMSFVSVLSEGFDYPPIDGVVLMRPMRSPVLYIQTVGRGLRPWEGKPNCLVLDYGQVVRTIGPLNDPSIAKGGGQRERDGQLKLVSEAPQRECPQCRTFNHARAKACFHCLFDFPSVVEKLDIKAGSGNILAPVSAPKPITQTMGPIIIGPHEAKSGNNCIKIQYCDKSVVRRWGFGGPAEFFVTSNAWAMQRLEQRLDSLDIDLDYSIDENFEFPGTFAVTTLQDGRYERVQKVRRLSYENPKSEVGFEEEDTSFNFGANSPEEIGF